jgi:hypothetical protein
LPFFCEIVYVNDGSKAAALDLTASRALPTK